MVDAAVRLQELLGDPDFLPEAVDWRAVEGELSLTLPRDYKEFCGSYPAMELDDFLSICHPTARDEYFNLIKNGMVQSADLCELVEMDPHQHAYGSYPNLGGLLAWGLNSFGQNIYWLTEGDSDSWKVVTGDLVDYHFVFDGTFSEFLVGTLEGTLKNPVLGSYENRLKKIEYIR